MYFESCLDKAESGNVSTWVTDIEFMRSFNKDKVKF